MEMFSIKKNVCTTIYIYIYIFSKHFNEIIFKNFLIVTSFLGRVYGSLKSWLKPYGSLKQNCHC